jgi:hypothetical protein
MPIPQAMLAGGQAGVICGQAGDWTWQSGPTTVHWIPHVAICVMQGAKGV